MASSPLPVTFVAGFHDEAAVRAMPYHPLGKTGLVVSTLGQGGASFSALFGEFEEEEAIATVRESIRLGINYIDTAPFYGQGRSEEVIGKALKGIPREAYYIATKVGRYERDVVDKMFDFSAEKTRWSIQNSLDLLGLDYVDIIQIHDIEFAPNLDQVINETLPVLQEAVAAGKARFIGLTGYPLSVLKEGIYGAPKGAVNTVLSYARNTLIDDELSRYMDFFKENNIAVISAAAHAMRMLTNTDPPAWHPADRETQAICKKAAEYCKSREVELGELAMYHTTLLDGCCTHLVGMNTRKVLRTNLDAVVKGLSDEKLAILEELKQRYFSKIQQRNWEGVEVKQYRLLLDAITKLTK